MKSFDLNGFIYILILQSTFFSDFRLQEHNVESAIAIIADGGVTLAVDTQHLRLNLRVGSLYQFIGELSIQPNNEVHKLTTPYPSYVKDINALIILIKIRNCILIVYFF